MTNSNLKSSGFPCERRHRGAMKSGRIKSGGMAEWLKAAVLKTVSGVTRSGVRIPLPPPYIC